MRNKKVYQARAEVTKALSHPLRLQIIDLLEEKEYCVCELTEILDASQSVISKHLGVLKKAGIISSRKEGLNNYYFIEVPCIPCFFGCLDEVLENKIKVMQEELLE